MSLAGPALGAEAFGRAPPGLQPEVRRRRVVDALAAVADEQRHGVLLWGLPVVSSRKRGEPPRIFIPKGSPGAAGLLLGRRFPGWLLVRNPVRRGLRGLGELRSCPPQRGGDFLRLDLHRS